MNYNELLLKISQLKEKMKNSKSFKEWKDTKKYYDKLLKEKKDFERFMYGKK